MRFFKDLFISERTFIILSAIIVLFVLGHFYPYYDALARTILIGLIGFFILDLIIVFQHSSSVSARRIAAEKLSNGDMNIIKICIDNSTPLTLDVKIIDELPVQLQERNFSIKGRLEAEKTTTIEYSILPKERGEYWFGALNLYFSTLLGLAQRRRKFEADKMLPVYPSIIQMKKFELFTITGRLEEAGLKRQRKLGHTMEFEHIRKYIRGDDYRTINWKATARKAEVMVNQFEDEKSQPLYCAIDMGRVMKMPFEGMTLLDYAINASLALTNVSVKKQDKAGIITFSHKLESLLPARRRFGQMKYILELLYNQATNFKESGFEHLYAAITHKLSQRSMIFLFTNFETLNSLYRQLPYLKAIAGRHLLVVIFFKNVELYELRNSPVRNTEELYIQTIAEKFAFEKKQITFELNRNGINNILTTPQQLTIDAINRYLEIKARGMI
ncbi:MAG: DUF58 domain-containing protein [Calditrichaceae bacterium]|nr:DUF58 domain-containing protein [Calditrichaceae bacterium]MBN2708697.1 DUF58 domain-containing protein [Calditrichaceae bacterium]RQV92809.1 MAG: DUF58 domain-containing protein [Calditrichota bacterium]